jgi:hypothetical protein
VKTGSKGRPARASAASARRRRPVGGGGPDHCLGPDRDARDLAIAALAEDEVEAALGLLGAQLVAAADLHLQPHLGVGAGEAGEDRGQAARHEMIGDAEPEPPGDGGGHQPAHRLVIQGQQAAGVAEQRLAVPGERDGAAGAAEERAADDLLQPLDAQADGGLGEAERLAGGRESARLGDEHEAAQQIEIEIGEAHGGARRFYRRGGRAGH